MRKSLIALACLSVVAGAATAAEVELYGTVDTYIAVNHNAGKTDVSEHLRVPDPKAMPF